MKFDSTLIKLSLLVLAQQIIGIAKHNSQRLIIREWFTKGELPFLQWFKIEFLLHLSGRQIFGLGVIAAFTLVTFPLGIWMGSFNIGKSYAVTNMVGTIVSLATLPVTLYTMAVVLKELKLNQTTWWGIGLIAVGQFVILGGCWLLYVGNNGG